MLVVDGVWNVDCWRGWAGRHGGGSGSWQGLGWWDDGGEREGPDTRHRIYSKFTKSEWKSSISPDRTNGKNTYLYPSHPFLSFGLKFDLEPARISLYLHLTRPFIHHIAHGDTGIKEARTATKISGMHRFSLRRGSRGPRQWKLYFGSIWRYTEFN